MKKTIFFQLLLILIAVSSYSQQVDSTKKVLITLKDETELIGYVISADSINVTLKSLSGIVSVIPRKEIIETKKLRSENIVGKTYYPPDPSSNHLFALPTAVPLKQGEGQFNAMEVLFPYVSFGVTDFINLGIGGLPFITSGNGTIFYFLQAKVIPVSTPNVSIAIGGAIAGASQSETFVGASYLVGTFGNTMGSFTLGGCMLFSKDEVFDRPAFMVGGQVRISKNASFISENVIVFGTQYKDYVAFPSFGVRFSGEKLAADFGTYAYVEKDHFFYPIPWIGLSYKF